MPEKPNDVLAVDDCRTRLPEDFIHVGALGAEAVSVLDIGPVKGRMLNRVDRSARAASRDILRQRTHGKSDQHYYRSKYFPNEPRMLDVIKFNFDGSVERDKAQPSFHSFQEMDRRTQSLFSQEVSTPGSEVDNSSHQLIGAEEIVTELMSRAACIAGDFMIKNKIPGAIIPVEHSSFSINYAWGITSPLRRAAGAINLINIIEYLENPDSPQYPICQEYIDRLPYMVHAKDNLTPGFRKFLRKRQGRAERIFDGLGQPALTSS